MRKRLPPSQQALTESNWVKWVLIVVSFSFIGVFLVVPLLTIFMGALEKGTQIPLEALKDSYTLSALGLTLKTAAFSVVLNLAFGVTAAWVLAKFEFVGKRFLLTLIDLPFTVSPVISGLIFVLLFGAHGVLGPFLQAHGLKIVFAVPGIILATIFVTFPYVARELIPLMQAQGNDQEEAALTLGAGGWRTFFEVTLPNIRWGLLYGVILLNARAMGEFGAVSVVSGHIRGQTNTLPLHVEILYNEYNLVGAFTVASMLTLLALFTLIGKTYVKYRSKQDFVHDLEGTEEFGGLHGNSR
ncbi:MAG: sulfate ABC transporter permease subunit CysW [bacterium]